MWWYKTFKIKNDVYFLMAESEDIVEPKHIRFGWHISFGIVKNECYIPTNNNIPFIVLYEVKKAFEEFLIIFNPSKISYIAEGRSKSKIYKNIIYCFDFMENFNYSIEHSDLEPLTDEIPYLIKMWNNEF